jgi:hypothetical protein
MDWISISSSRRRLLVNLLVLGAMLGALALGPSASGSDDMVIEDNYAAGCQPDITKPHTDGWGGVNCYESTLYPGMTCCECPSCCRITCGVRQ